VHQTNFKLYKSEKQMTITGKNLIAGQWSGDTEGGFKAVNAQTQQLIDIEFADATEIEVATAIERAHQAFESYSQLSANKRSNFLRSIGEEVLALGDTLVITASEETGLPAARIEGERTRTVNQLALFADLLLSGEYHGIVEPADNNRLPLAKPDTRLGYIPLGVVGVFAASNFPLAFSTAGGDTASALAAGCPVIMKAHAAHPATAELVAKAILRAIEKCQLDTGVFSLIQGKNYAIATQIVTHPLIKAVGFTGSERVGMILQNQIYQRPEPIPFYGELGSINPQFIMPNKVQNDSTQIAKALVDSLMMGQGQFCTSPGVWVISGSEGDDGYQNFIDQAKAAINNQPAGVMLTPAIGDSYKSAVAHRQTLNGVTLLAEGKSGNNKQCVASLFTTDFATFKALPTLQEEVFGFSALIVRCNNFSEMLELVNIIKGNLTASIHGVDKDIEYAKDLSRLLAHKVGRLIYNQMPTGVEVCASMNHGGPFPASTDSRTTSVGSEAINRFRRPICYQNMPTELLPSLLQDKI
jgi:NADP-dependent aldehyde dehydrogenase